MSGRVWLLLTENGGCPALFAADDLLQHLVRDLLNLVPVNLTRQKVQNIFRSIQRLWNKSTNTIAYK